MSYRIHHPPKQHAPRTAQWVIALSITLLIGCEQSRWLPPPGFVGDPAQGKTLYAARCVNCHGIEARGTLQGPPLVDDIYRPSHHADLAFHLAVKNGVAAHHWHFGDMPAQPGFTPEQVGHMVAWVRQEQRRHGIE